MRKIILGIGMIGMVLVSLASAGLVGFLSNSVTGTIEVLGPVFYTTSGKNLIMNDKPVSVSSKIFSGIEEIDFIMDEDLGGIEFYKPKLMFVVDVEISDYNVPRGIEVEFGYINENGNSARICNIQHVGIVEDGVVKIPCDGTVAPNNVKHFYYTIEGMGDSYLQYTVYTKNSYVKVTGALP